MKSIRNIAILLMGITLIYSFTAVSGEEASAAYANAGFQTLVVGGGGCSSEYNVSVWYNGVQIGPTAQTNSACIAYNDMCNQPNYSYTIFADNGSCSGSAIKKWTGGCLGIVQVTVHADNCYAPKH